MSKANQYQPIGDTMQNPTLAELTEVIKFIRISINKMQGMLRNPISSHDVEEIMSDILFDLLNGYSITLPTNPTPDYNPIRHTVASCSKRHLVQFLRDRYVGVFNLEYDYLTDTYTRVKTYTERLVSIEALLDEGKDIPSPLHDTECLQWGTTAINKDHLNKVLSKVGDVDKYQSKWTLAILSGFKTATELQNYLMEF